MTPVSVRAASRHAPTRYRTPLALAAALLCAESVCAQSTPAAQLDTVVVKSTASGEAERAKLKLEDVAGGVSLVRNDEVERGRAATAEDVLALVPGVYARAAGGNDAIKISIRGSGINTSAGYFRESTKFLFDGLALTGAGGTPYELLEMSGIAYTEVLRGANAFDYGALTLGGAINFATHTGQSAPGWRVRLEGGSFGWQKAQVSGGAVLGAADVYVSIADSKRSGFQDWTYTKATGLVANLGYSLSPSLQTRLFVRWRQEYHENAASLTLANLLADPSQTTAAVRNARGDSTKDGSTWIGSKTTYRLDDASRLEFGLVWHDYPQTLSRYSSVNPNDWLWRDLNLSLRYLRNDTLAGLPSATTVSLSSTRHLPAGVKTYNGVTRALLKEVRYDGSHDHVLALGNELGLSPALTLSSGLSVVHIRRNIDVRFTDRANTSPFPAAYDYRNLSLAPRLGLSWQASEQVQVFGNVSRTIDPPSSWSSSGSGVTNNYAKRLYEQRANTIEAGLRGSHGIFNGSLAVYRTWLRGELLNNIVVPATATTAAVTSTFNASPTIHQGVEAGLDARLWKAGDGQQLVLRQAYTYNDFYYRNDKIFGSNQLPGLPQHVYQGELQYQAPSGLYASFSVSSSSSTFVDYANSFTAPSFTIYGAKVGWEAPSKAWQVFVEGKNLANKAYVSSVSTQYNAAGRDTASLVPGDGRGFFAGVSFRL